MSLFLIQEVPTKNDDDNRTKDLFLNNVFIGVCFNFFFSLVL